MQTKIPRLDALVSEWRANGSPNQEGYPWVLSKAKWTQLADEFHVDIVDFPDLIDRQFLWNISASTATAQTSFLAVMIWGYGDIGYGPHRVRQMFQSSGFASSLDIVKSKCRDGQTLEAYELLKNSRIRQLGPSFGSKVLTFFHDPATAPAILDSIVANWLNEYVPSLLGGKKVNAETWNVQTYARYIGWSQEVSEAYEIAPCSLEQLVFTDGYGS